jgi:hypothetical protein
MSRGPHAFKKRDVVRAVQAAQAAGLSVQRIELDKSGRIVIVTGEESASGAWDDAIAELEAK